jgi:microcystin-dependent protein
MKKSFLVFFLFFISLNFFAQGIAVQGIARDNASSAITGTLLPFTFSITQDDNTVLYAEKQSITTDNYGVFSHIVKNGNPLGAAMFSAIDFSIQNLKMKVMVKYNNIDIEVYNQPFQYTPYAHFAANAANAVNAANGVPTGSIIAFIGGNVNSAPPGWVKCEGQDLSPTSENAALIALVGIKAPDLRGLFLRGTGTNLEIGNTLYAGPPLKEYQDMATEVHRHSILKANVKTEKAGSHRHNIERLPQDNRGNVNSSIMSLTDTSGSDEAWATVNGGGLAISSAGDHEHAVSGETEYTGGIETRPANFGVVYIIKL